MNPISLCESCLQCRQITSGTGSRFFLCEASLTDSRFPKYPPQPVGRCPGFESDRPLYELETAGYSLIRGILGPESCRRLRDEILEVIASQLGAIESTNGKLVGARNLLQFWDGWREIVAIPTLQRILLRIVGQKAGLVRILYFDKPPGKGWSLAIHTDKTIAVAEHQEPAAPFSKPTTKAGVPHVEANQQLLDEMLTVRIHLDEMHGQNGPLIVVPGSHRETDQQSGDVQQIESGAGDVFLMRPLLSHGSRAADETTKDHRRVVHLEFAPSDQLPAGYRWQQFEPILNR